MNMSAGCFILLLAIILSSCVEGRGWNTLSYDKSIANGSPGTECVTDHQGEHTLVRCDIRMDGDTLLILFPAQLPAYWGWAEIKIADDKFNSQFGGVSFVQTELTFETIAQELVLNKECYSLNDTLYGYCNFSFKETEQEQEQGRSNTFYFKGPIKGIVRELTFDPLEPNNFMTFDIETALMEIGEPERRICFDMSQCSRGLEVELLNIFQRNEAVVIEKITWSGFDFSGQERLTIWYVREKDKTKMRSDLSYKLPPIWESADTAATRLLPVLYKRWDIYTQF